MHQYTKCWTIILKTTTKGSPYIPMAKARGFTALLINFYSLIFSLTLRVCIDHNPYARSSKLHDL